MRILPAVICLGAILAAGCAGPKVQPPQETEEEIPRLPGPAAGRKSDDGRFLPRGFSREIVTIECNDRYMLNGELLRRQRTRGKLPGVILLHGQGQSRNVWYPLTMQLAARGFAVLSVDLRGHGENSKQERKPGDDPGQLTDEDLLAMPQDIRNVVAHLAMTREINGGQLAIAGMSLGADLAIITAAQPWADAIRCVIAISPGSKSHGPAALAAAREMSPGKAVYVVARRDDEPSLATAKRIMAALDGPKELFQAEADAQGKILRELLTKMPVWLMSCLGPRERPSGPDSPRP